jgi:hypothetical protein
MAENQTVSAIDDDSKFMLEEHVKKGKPRKFILICKGASIKTLVVFKKGPYGVKINQAKKSGFRGDVYCGVISGKGANINLQLPGNASVSDAMGTEGNVYDSEPCKVAKLRDFFVEEARLKVHPEFTIVTARDQVVSVSESDDEDASFAAESEERSDPPATAASPSAPSRDRAELKQKLADGLKLLLPRVQQAIKARPDRKDEILAIANKFNAHLKSNDLDAAKLLFAECAKIVQQLTASSRPAAAGAGEWDARVAQLTPRLKQVLGEKLGDYSQAAALFKQARERQAANRPESLELLAECEQLVDAALSSVQAAATGDADGDALRKARADVDVDKEAMLEQAIRNLEPARWIDSDQLIAEAKQQMQYYGYDGALKFARNKHELARTIEKGDASGLGKTFVDEAFRMLNEWGFLATMAEITARIETEKRRQADRTMLGEAGDNEIKLERAIYRFKPAQWIDDEQLIAEAKQRLETVGYRGALRFARQKHHLARLIERKDVYGLGQAFAGEALNTLDERGFRAALVEVRQRLKEEKKRLDESYRWLQSVDVDEDVREFLMEALPARIERDGVDRAFGFAQTVIDLQKDDSQVREDFSELVFGDDGDGFAELLDELGESAVAELYQSFEGRAGLADVRRILKDICHNDVYFLDLLIEKLAPLS